ncbi:hypothetical protein [Halococcus salsus]|uniref:hypothetical protein n=1 Tax=Halococcus salsus TaxID=2162894 RepID=UPI0013593271|nr:hypothetical protein [Halococcus salsus]
MAHGATGPIDDHVLDTIHHLASTHRFVGRAYLNDDPGGRRELYVELDPNHYPEAIETVTLQVRWYETDDYTFHYREDWETGEWQCRWDRHPNPHNAAREHFHEPPTAADDPITDPVDRVEPHYLFVRTIANVSERIEQAWENESS